jgi:hypothetical protein
MSINKKAMLVYLNISIWTARKYDKRVSREIEAKYQADEAGRYNKILIAKAHLANIKKIISSARTFHYDNTLPWDDKGGRLLPAANYFNYISNIRSFKDAFEREINHFLAVYPNLKEEARQRLHGLFNEEDYPDPGSLAAKFAFRNSILPLPAAQDFRVELRESEVESIRESIKEQIEASTQAAQHDLWQRIFKVVSHMSERLSDPDNKFKNSLVSNISELCDLFPKLNVTNDAKLDKAVAEIKAKLTVHDSQVLRENDTIRNKTAVEAQKIMNKMRDYLPAA